VAQHDVGSVALIELKLGFKSRSNRPGKCLLSCMVHSWASAGVKCSNATSALPESRRDRAFHGYPRSQFIPNGNDDAAFGFWVTAITVDADVLIIDEAPGRSGLRVSSVQMPLMPLQVISLITVARSCSSFRDKVPVRTPRSTSALLLEHGRVMAEGLPADVIGEYVGWVTLLILSRDSRKQTARTSSEIANGLGKTGGNSHPDGGRAKPSHHRQAPGDAEILPARPQPPLATGVRTPSGSPHPTCLRLPTASSVSLGQIQPGMQFAGEQGEYLYGFGAEKLLAPSSLGNPPRLDEDSSRPPLFMFYP